jgi:hypothetical protein
MFSRFKQSLKNKQIQSFFYFKFCWAVLQMLKRLVFLGMHTSQKRFKAF